MGALLKQTKELKGSIEFLNFIFIFQFIDQDNPFNIENV